MRTCPECSEPVPGRAKRHPECKKADHARRERDRRNAAKSGAGEWAPDESCAMYQSVVDYTVPGAASRPPMYETHPPPRRELVTEEVVDYTRGGRGRPSIYEHRNSLDGVKGADRRDLVKAQQLARALAADDEPELASWDQVQAHDDRTVNFGRGMDGSVLRYDPGPRITNQAAAGQLYGPAAHVPAAAVLGQVVVGPQPKIAARTNGQHIPHIVN
jgi:hypothetical protein